MAFGNDDNNNKDCPAQPARKTQKKVTPEDVREAEDAVNYGFMDVAGCSDEFRALYWPMDKWFNETCAAEMLSTIISAYPGLAWNNPLSSQFTAMLSVVRNIDWIDEIRGTYDIGLVDFMRLIFMNWSELFTRKKYVATLSATIVSTLSSAGKL